MKKIKNILLYIMFILCILPNNIYAYSDYIAVSGKNIGIQIKSEGVLVVGLYSIDNISPGKDAGIKVGDYIIKINSEKVDSVDDMVNKINKYKDEDIIITYNRNNKEYNTNLKLVKKDNIYKTGLYVKDTISGIGTLTYIDPETKMYGALGHAIIDKNSMQSVDIKDGKIYKSIVTGIIKSKNGVAGEKNAEIYPNETFGIISKNTSSGIFGKYTGEVNTNNLYKVANINEITTGKAKILTVLNGNEIEEYEINITRLNNEGVKNISFTVTDSNLISKTGGIVQGMSGSPIMQDGAIIGVVTHVIVDNPLSGYGLFITKMLEEGES